MNTTSVDAYLAEGCGRCDLYRTPACKVHAWTDTLVALRALVGGHGLTEEMKWGVPCYTLDGANVLTVSALKACAVLGFFQGAHLPDPEGLLEAAGPNTRIGRQVRFTSADQVTARAVALSTLVDAAIAFQRSGARPAVEHEVEPLPAALIALLDARPDVRTAFEALTPGRQRSYVLHVGGAKAEATRAARAERCVERILAGKGFHER